MFSDQLSMAMTCCPDENLLGVFSFYFALKHPV